MNDDLISRKAVFELIDSKAVNGALMFGEKLMIDGYGLMDEVSDLPTAYNLDVVVSKLETLAAEYEERANNKYLGAEKKKNLAKMHSYRYAYNIVKDGGIGGNDNK